jgi:hypothetical protein
VRRALSLCAPNTIHRQYAYICEILIDRKFFAHFIRIQVTELMEGCLEVRLRKNFSTKKRFGHFLIWIRIQDSDPDSNPGSESGFESGFESGSETVSETFVSDPQHWSDSNPRGCVRY